MGAGPAGDRRHRYLFPAAAGSVTALAAVVPGGPPGPGGGFRWIVPVAAVIAGSVLWLLRRRPVLGVVVCSAVDTGTQLVVGDPTGLVVLVILALLLLALQRPLRTALALLGLCCSVHLIGDLLTGGFDSRVLAPLALMVAGTAAGVAVAAQQAAARAATERAAAAERSREDEADRRVADERLRMARELHDVVAHHVAVMSVQAGAAEQLLDTDREQVRAALGQVRTSGRTALAELGAVVGLLRSRADPVTDRASDQMAPVAVGLERLPELVSTVRAAGLRLSVVAPPSAMAAGLGEFADIAAYRIVQESLTNAMCHGSGQAELTLGLADGRLTLTVVNPLPDPAAAPEVSGTGHGLLGMRERATLAGADLTAGPTEDGDFWVRASFPVQHQVRP